MSLYKTLIMIVVVMLLVAGLYACKKEGPAEQAGKRIDKVLGDAKDKLDEAIK